ncbi:MAG: DUF1694 domain-containing protein [Fusobacteriaceae bacterium]
MKKIGGIVTSIESKQEEVRNNFMKKQLEKEYYLQEFKERVIISLNKDEVQSEYIYPEIIEALHEPDAVAIKMRRDIELKFLKPYINIAEKLGKKYILVDSSTLMGEVGLVVISKDELDNENINLAVDAVQQEFEKRGLKSYYANHIGKKICKKHYKLIEEKYPLYKGSFIKFGVTDVLFGAVCPICEDEKKDK